MAKTKIKSVTFKEKKALLKRIIKYYRSCNLLTGRDQEVFIAILKDVDGMQHIQKIFA